MVSTFLLLKWIKIDKKRIGMEWSNEVMKKYCWSKDGFHINFSTKQNESWMYIFEKN